MGLHDEDVEPFEHFEPVARPGCLIKGMCMEDGKPVKHLEPVADFKVKGLFTRRVQVTSKKSYILRMLILLQTLRASVGSVCWARLGGLAEGLYINDVEPVKHLEPAADFEGEGTVH